MSVLAVNSSIVLSDNDTHKVKSSRNVEEGVCGFSITLVKNQFDKIFEASKEVQTGPCVKKLKACSIEIMASSKMEYTMYLLSFGSWVLLTTASAMQLYFSSKQSAESEGAKATFGIGLSALVIQGLVASVWCIHTKFKGKADDEKRDKQLVKKFVQALKDHKIASIETLPTIEPLPLDHMKSESQECIYHYDNLTPRIKEKILPRELWIIGLIKGLPVNHPLQSKLERMLLIASQLQNEIPKQNEDVGSSSDHSSDDKGKQKSQPLHEVLKSDLREIEDFIGSKQDLLPFLINPEKG